MSVKIYTDGSSLGNPGPSGWASIILEDDETEIILSGNDKYSTNNRMELLAIIKGIEFVCENNIIIYSDSKLSINCSKRIWKRKKNLDLWKLYDKVSQNKDIKFIWVKGHNGDKYNVMADKIAKEEAKKIK